VPLHTLEFPMLLLTRKKQESVIIGAPGCPDVQVRVTILGINGKQVKLGFEADGEVSIQRWELWQRINSIQLEGSITAECEAVLVSES